MPRLATQVARPSCTRERSLNKQRAPSALPTYLGAMSRRDEKAPPAQKLADDPALWIHERKVRPCRDNNAATSAEFLADTWPCPTFLSRGFLRARFFLPVHFLQGSSKKGRKGKEKELHLVGKASRTRYTSRGCVGSQDEAPAGFDFTGKRKRGRGRGEGGGQELYRSTDYSLLSPARGNSWRRHRSIILPMGKAIDNANGCALGNRLNECLQKSSARDSL